jgi:hypothetical protein
LQVERPTALPSLTPFPTPSPAATPADVAAGGGPERPGDGGERQGLLDRLLAVDVDRFGRAFWWGARLALYPFLLLGLYLVVRTVGRRLWRLLLAKIMGGRG